jgi:undecaprenyl phosphate-alpha-L-ara4N flippase subunit ArnE
MHEYKTIALIFPLLASISAVGGQLLYKHSARLKKAISGGIIWLLILGMGNLLFILSIVLNFIAMKYIPLFIVYSFTAMNYVFVTIASRMLLKERVKINNILASLLIAVGVFLTTIK